MFWNEHRHTSRGSILISGWTTSTCSRSARKSSPRPTPRKPPLSSSQPCGARGCASHPNHKLWHADLSLPNAWPPCWSWKGNTSKVPRSPKIWASISREAAPTVASSIANARVRPPSGRAASGSSRNTRGQRSGCAQPVSSQVLPTASLSWAHPNTRSSACDAKCAPLLSPTGQAAAPTQSLPTSATGRTPSQPSPRPSSERGWRHGPTLRISGAASGVAGPAFSRASQRPHRTDGGDAHTDLSGACCCAPRPRLGRLTTQNDGHLPTARLFSSPSRTCSPIQARFFRCFEASLFADFWLAADSGYCGLGLAGGCDTTVLRRQWNTLYKSDPGDESALCARCGQHDETEAHRLWERERKNTTHSSSCQDAWRRRNLPGPLDQGLGARTVPPQDPDPHGEHTVAFGNASGGRHASDTRCRRVGTAGAAWSDTENMSTQQLLDKTAPDGDEEEAEHATEPLSKRLEKAFTMRAGWVSAPRGATNDAKRRVLGLHSRPHTNSQTLIVLRRLFGARFWVSSKPPPFPVWPTQEIMDTYWIPRRQQKLIGGSPPRGQPRHCGGRS